MTTSFAFAICSTIRLIHGYEMVDLEILWDTVTDDLLPLIAVRERIVPPV